MGVARLRGCSAGGSLRQCGWSAEEHLHKDIGAGVGRGRKTGGIDVAEAEGLVEVDGGCEGVVGFDVEAGCAGFFCGVDGGAE